MARKKKAKKNRSKGGGKPAVGSNNQAHNADEVEVDAPEIQHLSAVEAVETADEHGSSLTSDEEVEGGSKGNLECVVSDALQNEIFEEFKGAAESSIEHEANGSQPDAGVGESACGKTESTVAQDEAIEQPASDTGIVELSEAPETSNGVEGRKEQQRLTDTEHAQDSSGTADEEMKYGATREMAVTDIAENTENPSSEESHGEESHEHAQDLNGTADEEMKDGTTPEMAATDIAENTENPSSEESHGEESEIEQVQSRPQDGDADDNEEERGPVEEQIIERGDGITENNLACEADGEMKDGATRENQNTVNPSSEESHGEESELAEGGNHPGETSDLVCETTISNTVEEQRSERGDGTTDDIEESEGQAGFLAETPTGGSSNDNSTIETIGGSNENRVTEVERDFSISSTQDEFVSPKQKTSFGSQFSRDLSDVDLDSESGKEAARRFSSNDDILPLNCDPSTDIEAFRFLVGALRKELGDDANGFSDRELSQFTRWKPDVKAASGRFREYLKFRRENAYLYEKPMLVSENPHLAITLRTGFVLAPEDLIAVDGSCVMIIRAAKCDPSQPECGDKEVSKAIFFTLHSIMGRKSLDPVKGLTIILDLGGVTRKNINKRIPSMLSKAGGCLPIRIRSIIVVSQPWWFPNHQKLLRQKIRSRVKHLKQKRALEDYIDRDKILIEDGGNASFDLKSALSNIILQEVDAKYGHEGPPGAEKSYEI